MERDKELKGAPFCKRLKHIKGSKFKYCYHTLMPSGRIIYRAKISKFNWVALFSTEREALLAIDKKLIEKGFEPIHILKRKL